MTTQMNHYHTSRHLWHEVSRVRPGDSVEVTGHTLSVAQVVAVSKGNGVAQLPNDDALHARIRSSVEELERYLASGNTVYGVTTGSGGSADSRTKQMNKLQVALLQLTQSGVLLASDKRDDAPPPGHSSVSHAMPSSWVKATMIVRCNATARGHSAVTLEVLQTILALLRHDLTPVIPLRGTVSASGDLMPLAYIAGVLEGNPDIAVRRKDGSLTTAKQAMAEASLPKIIFGLKEALGLVNGTAPSAALATLVIYDAQQLAVLVQALTAIAVEALLGNSESFHPFIAQVRPHAGQIEAAAVTSAMEKTRLALQMLGKLLFAQSTEIIDPSLNNGLPANLAADDPSTSFTVKGVDINMAAYMSELAFLASPVSSHVQAAEMHNQSINSLAFVSARTTQQSVELVSLMVASRLFIDCQALDLRVLQRNFFDGLPSIIADVNAAHFGGVAIPGLDIGRLSKQILGRIEEAWKGASRLDISERYEKVWENILPVLVSLLEDWSSKAVAEPIGIEKIQKWKQDFEPRLVDLYETTYDRFKISPNTIDYIRVGAGALDDFVRNELQIPFHLGVTDHPVGFENEGSSKRTRRTVGSWISIIYKALLQGKASDALYRAMESGNYINGIH